MQEDSNFDLSDPQDVELAKELAENHYPIRFLQEID